LCYEERSHEDQRVVYKSITDVGRDIHEEADKEASLKLSAREKEKLFELLVKI
jgi:DNA-binding MarR family transcriptional regulator